MHFKSDFDRFAYVEFEWTALSYNLVQMEWAQTHSNEVCSKRDHIACLQCKFMDTTDHATPSHLGNFNR